jgi:hypothetical protein
MEPLNVAAAGVESKPGETARNMEKICEVCRDPR